MLGHGVCESIEIPRRIRALEMLKVKQIATGAAHTGKKQPSVFLKMHKYIGRLCMYASAFSAIELSIFLQVF